MQPPQHGQRCLTVQLTDIPIVVLENELAGEEDAVGKFRVDFFGELRQLLNRVGTEGEVCFGRKTVVVAIVHKIGQSLVCLPPQPLEVLTPP